MRALQVTVNGRPGDVLAVRTVEQPEPGPGEVRVKVGAASLNFNDIDRCRGKLVSVPTPPPYTLGMDVCGVVDAAGDGAEGWLGKRVVAITKTALGGIATYMVHAARMLHERANKLRRTGKRMGCTGHDDCSSTSILTVMRSPHVQSGCQWIAASALWRPGCCGRLRMRGLGGSLQN